VAICRVTNAKVAAAVLTLAAVLHLPQAWTLYGQLLPRDLYALYRGTPLYTPADIQGARALQEAAPPGAPIFARLAYPFIMDFKRNPIYIIDWPGGYYLTTPRNAKLLEGSETLRAYLLSCNLRYVAYSYQSEASFPRKRFESRLHDPNALVRHSTRATLDFQANLDALRHSYHNLYDDGRNVLIDLRSPAGTRP
jgi:hypothetical protein